MIVEALLGVVLGVVWVILYPLTYAPDVSLPANVAAAIATTGSYLATVSHIANVPTLLLVFAFVMIVEHWHFFYKLLMWAIRKIPGVG